MNAAKITSVIVLLLAVFSFAFFSESKRATQMNYFLSTATIDQVVTLDPSKIRVIVEYHLIHNATIQLFGLDEIGNYSPRLAESVIWSQDKKTIHLRIRNAHFSNGDPILARDVSFTIQRQILRGSPHSDPNSFIKGAKELKKLDIHFSGIEVLNENELKIHFNYPVKEVLYYLQLADYGILHSSQYQLKRDLTPGDWRITSGPYSIHRDLDHKLSLMWNDTYGDRTHRIQKIRSITSEGVDRLKEYFKTGNLLIGTVGFADYYELLQSPNSMEKYQMVGSKYTAIAALLLNLNHEKLKKVETRRWVLRRIIKHLSVPEKYTSLLEKAYQYFLPGAPGYIDPRQIQTQVDTWNLSDAVPSELRDGIEIVCRRRLKTFVPLEIKSYLEEALGIPIRISFEIELDQYATVLNARTFESMLIVPSMSYKVLGESLNLLYLSSPHHALDPSQGVRTHLTQFHNSSDPDSESKSIAKILKHMTEDAEVVPLFYSGYMKFYQSEKLDASEVSFMESLLIYKYKFK